MATKRGWVVVWPDGRYARLRMYEFLGRKGQSWDQTENRDDAHVFRTKKEAVRHIEELKEALPRLKTIHVEKA
jgi:hypothetical protein